MEGKSGGRTGSFIGEGNADSTDLLLLQSGAAKGHFGWSAANSKFISLLYWKIYPEEKNAFIDAREIGDKDFRQHLERYGLKEKKYCMRYLTEDGEEKVADITYQTLSARLKRKIDFAPITLVEINVDSKGDKERTLHKIFANLNVGGTPLSSQELRNGIYGCKFYDMLYELNDNNQKWRLLYSGNKNADVSKESKDVELLLRMCAFKYYVQREGEELRLLEYKGKLSVLLNDFSEKAKDFGENQILEYKNALVSFFDSLDAIGGRNKGSALVSLFVAWDQMERKPFISRNKYEEIIGSGEYQETIASGTSERSAIEKRLRSVYEQLSRYD